MSIAYRIKALVKPAMYLKVGYFRLTMGELRLYKFSIHWVRQLAQEFAMIVRSWQILQDLSHIVKHFV